MAKSRLIELKNRANDEAQQIMKSIVNQSKLTPYDECINPRLKDFTDKPYIKSHCMDLYGESKIDKCTQKKEFCPMCCEFHIGSKFSNKRKDCSMRCKNLIFGKKPGNKVQKKGKNKKTKKAKKVKK